jgi:hypothetical protein
MHGSASKIKARTPAPCVRVSRGVCPTCSHVPTAGGTAKMRADWAFVSGVSLVSPYLELLDKRRKWRVGKAVEGINRSRAPFTETGGTGATTTRFQGETTGARLRRDSETVR